MNTYKFFALLFITAVSAFAQQAQPVQPAQPAQPVQSAQPAQPVQPAQPAQPAQQFPWDEQSAPKPSDPSAPVSLETVASPQPAPSSSSAEATPPSEEKSIFDSVRGRAYNPFGTVGAASTVRDLVTTPSDINGQKFFYVSPTSGDPSGYLAFGFGEGSALIGLDNSVAGNLAALILGFANSSFGIALNYSIAKTWVSNDKTNTRTTDAGDNIGLYISMPSGIYANVSWLTYGPSYATEAGRDEESEDYSEIQAKVGLTGKSNSLNYDGFLNFIRTGGTRITADKDRLVDSESYTGLALNFNLGYEILQNQNARIILGSNNFLSMQIFEEIGNTKGDTKMGLVIAPNILGEVALFKNWLAFAGATHAINLLAGDGDRNNKTSLLSIRQTAGNAAFAGVRYQKTNWAVEAKIADAMFSNPLGGLNGDPMFAEFSGFIYF